MSSYTSGLRGEDYPIGGYNAAGHGLWSPSPARYAIIAHHGETAKNIQDRHGTTTPNDELLTPRGIQQSVWLGQVAASHAINQYSGSPGTKVARLDIVAANQPRLQQTAVVMKHAADRALYLAGFESVAQVRIETYLRGIKMGSMLDGRSDGEIQRRFPVFAAHWGQWRHNLTDVTPIIPGDDAEPTYAFLNRTRRGLLRALSLGAEVVALVCSTSTVAALDYVLRHPDQERWDKNQIVHMPYVNLPLGGSIHWQRGDDGWMPATPDFQLPGPMQFPLPPTPDEPTYMQ